MNLFYFFRKSPEALRIIGDWVGGGAKTVPQEKAQARADTCMACPMNKPNYVLEVTAGEALRKLLEVRSQLKIHVRDEQRLHTCEACGCPLVPKVHAPIEHVAKGINFPAGELDRFWEHCWIKKELKT